MCIKVGWWNNSILWCTVEETSKYVLCQQRGYNFLIIIIITSASKTKILDPMARNMPAQKPLAVLPNTRWKIPCKKSQLYSKWLHFPSENHSPQLYCACAKRNLLIVGPHLSPASKNFKWLFLSLTHIQMSIPLTRSITPQSEVLFLHSGPQVSLASKRRFPLIHSQTCYGLWRTFRIAIRQNKHTLCGLLRQKPSLYNRLKHRYPTSHFRFLAATMWSFSQLAVNWMAT